MVLRPLPTLAVMLKYAVTLDRSFPVLETTVQRYTMARPPEPLAAEASMVSSLHAPMRPLYAACTLGSRAFAGPRIPTLSAAEKAHAVQLRLVATHSALSRDPSSVKASPGRSVALLSSVTVSRDDENQEQVLEPTPANCTRLLQPNTPDSPALSDEPDSVTSRAEPVLEKRTDERVGPALGAPGS